VSLWLAVVALTWQSGESLTLRTKRGKEAVVRGSELTLATVGPATVALRVRIEGAGATTVRFVLDGGALRERSFDVRRDGGAELQGWRGVSEPEVFHLVIPDGSHSITVASSRPLLARVQPIRKAQPSRAVRWEAHDDLVLEPLVRTEPTVREIDLGRFATVSVLADAWAEQVASLARAFRVEPFDGDDDGSVPAALAEALRRRDLLVVEPEATDDDPLALVDLGGQPVGSMESDAIVAGGVHSAGAERIVTIGVALGTALVLHRMILGAARPLLVAPAPAPMPSLSPLERALRSAALPGWGQWTNREPLKAAAFATLGLGSAGAALGYGLAALAAQSEYARDLPSTVQRRQDANSHRSAANWWLRLLAATWAVSVLDAYGSAALSVGVGPGAVSLASSF
jgi:hypothetical protein